MALTAEDRQATIDLARELNPTYASFHVAAPYPGAVLGTLYRGNDDFPACLDNEHDLELLARETRRAMLSFYLRPGYIMSRLGELSRRNPLEKLRLLWEFIR